MDTPTDPQPGSRKPFGGAAFPKEQTHGSWSLGVGSIAGIPIRIHATFWLILIWVAYMARRQGEPIATQLALVGGLFACVVLHELGHALTARIFGIRTRDITLYPIGGVASLQSMGSPVQELLISLAGPATNILIAIVVAAVSLGRGDPLLPTDMEKPVLSFLQWLLVGNIMLALFNVLPAFPMDGGRILRAALALFMDKARATQIAARIGQGFAILMGVWGVVGGNFLLLFVALFVFLGAGAEAQAQQTAATTSGYMMRHAMITRFETVSHGDTLGTVVERLLRTSQEDFPVVHGGRVLGLLTRRALLASLVSEGKDAIVAGVMNREIAAVRPGDDLSQALDLLRATGSTPLLVFEDEALVGMITLDNLIEFLSVARAGGIPRPSTTS